MRVLARSTNPRTTTGLVSVCLVATFGCGDTTSQSGTRQTVGAEPAGAGGSTNATGASGAQAGSGGSTASAASGASGSGGGAASGGTSAVVGGAGGAVAPGGAGGTFDGGDAAGASGTSNDGGTAGAGATSDGGGAGGSPVATSCGPPAKAGAALTGLSTDFCVDGWCPLTPHPTPESFVDALLFDDDVWVAATERQVIIRTPGGLARLGDPLPGTIAALAGVSATNLYAAVRPDGVADVVFHFDGATWSAVPGTPSFFWNPRALALSPTGSVFLLDGPGRVARFDGCGAATVTDALEGDWTSISSFAVIDDDRMVGLGEYGGLVRWNAGLTTKVPLDWKPDGGSGWPPTSRLVASSFDDVHVATPTGLYRVQGQTSALVSPGNARDVSADPTTPGKLVALVVTWENNSDVVKLLSFSAPGAPPIPEVLPPSGPFTSPHVARARGDRRLVFSRGGGHAFWEGKLGAWSSLYTKLPPVNWGSSWAPRASFAGPSSEGVHVTWSNGVFQLDGSSLSALPALPASNWEKTELFGGGGGPVFALGRKSLTFASFAAGAWSSLPSPPIKGSTSEGLHVGYATPTDIFVAHAQILTPGIRHEPPFAPPESRTVVHFDGVGWTAIPTATTCSVRAIAALGGGKALAATKGCGVLRFEQGTWTPVAGLEAVDAREIVANTDGVCLAKDAYATVYRITGSVVETFSVTETFSALQSRGSEFFGVTYDAGLGSIRSIGRFSAGDWETVTKGSPLLNGSAWSRLHVTDDAFFLATASGDLVRRAR